MKIPYFVKWKRKELKACIPVLRNLAGPSLGEANMSFSDQKFTSAWIADLSTREGAIPKNICGAICGAILVLSCLIIIVQGVKRGNCDEL